ncbi:MAG TPA: SLBB domain-containing protein, partial [Longimicrobium sp.]|nr:SLBB domain-containing protein [Longimicrobium sp.]
RPTPNALPMRRVLPFVLAVLFAAVPLAAQVPGDALMLQPGDVLKITVWENEAMSGDVTVGPDGVLMHPLYRQVRVTGVPLAEVDARMRAFLERFVTNPQFVAEPLLRVAVGGEVRQPNLYTLAPGTTVAQAIVLAGGPTERGRLDRVRLVRGGRESLLDLTDPAAPMAATAIQSGDQFYVSRRNLSIYREYLAPAGGLLAALVSLLNFATR